MKQWQSEWAHNKYWVMARSQHAYNRIRELARNNEWTDESQAEYQQLLASLVDQQPTRATLTTAYQHIWGYFKRVASQSERKQYLQLLEQLTPTNDLLGPFLVTMTDKYQDPYLLSSRIIQELRSYPNETMASKSNS
ncbi:YbgA family protein [Lactobacillus sp. Sy-1]|uniref:YbgA family protein n=1 Tax=Lactobacillus sp. Sy-1 TaxID=2109645 RepID=UPI001C57F35F|nr:YbgA family protein [Lactobacillus sp. Sy-1]MBW1605074.1 YbgA family protein [Lactobacillus sp. Sy-1]